MLVAVQILNTLRKLRNYMNKIELNSVSKINIGLNILNRRDDGYHNLQTIFYPLLLADKIIFEKSDKTTFNSDSPELNNLKSNLVVDAKNLLEELVKSKLNVRIYIEKKIPIGGGLGGGSSDAASTLNALNTLFNLKLTYKKLLSLAIQLGSDIPFFLNPVPCLATSRGELMKQVQLSISYPILIINPGIHISTKWAFQQLKNKSSVNDLNKISSKSLITLDDVKKYATNDFEDIVFKHFPLLKEIKEKLYLFGAEFALMTGTGSTVYGIFTNLQKAGLAKEDFETKYFTFLNYPLDKGSIT